MNKISFSVAGKLLIEAFPKENQDSKLWVIHFILNESQLNVFWPRQILIRISNEINIWNGKENVGFELVNDVGALHYKLSIKNNGGFSLEGALAAIFQYADGYIRLIELMHRSAPVTKEALEATKMSLEGLAKSDDAEALLLEARDVANIPFYNSQRFRDSLHNAGLVDAEGYMSEATKRAVLELIDVDADGLNPILI